MNPYQKALARLNGRQSVKVANNTRLVSAAPTKLTEDPPRVNDGNAVFLCLHSTYILTFNPDGSTVATSGGWKTSTTKDRLNSWLPHGWGVCQDKGQWYWLPPRKEGFDWANWKAGRVLFTDGDSIGPRGALRAQAKAGAETETSKARREVLRFAKLCADSLPLDKPGAGDCFYCQMVTETGEPLGDATKNTDHLREHIREGYVVPSMVWRAMKEAGFNPSAGQLILAATFGEAPGMEGLARRHVKSAVASFLFRRFGMVARGGWASGSPVSGYVPHCQAV